MPVVELEVWGYKLQLNFAKKVKSSKRFFDIFRNEIRQAYKIWAYFTLESYEKAIMKTVLLAKKSTHDFLVMFLTEIFQKQTLKSKISHFSELAIISF